MTGRYEIVLYDNKICYRLDVKRNITVLRGDSASGKSELFVFLEHITAILRLQELH